jgi:hypothetical protein
MKIETLDDWHQIGCCCPMPACPAPDRECQSIQGSGEVGYVVYDSLTATYYGLRRTDYANGGFTQSVAPSTHWTRLGGESIEPYQIDFTQGDPKTGAITTTNDNIVDIDASRNASFAAMGGAIDWESMDLGTDCIASRSHPTPFARFPAYHLFATFVRFRWVVPTSFPGKHFKITWDVIEEPDGWDQDPLGSSRSFLVQDQTWEWTGPGDPGNPDSWKSAWYEIPAPAVVGQRRVVNIRFECYRSNKFGTKPQLGGDHVEL